MSVVVACPGHPDCQAFLPHEHDDKGLAWFPRALVPQVLATIPLTAMASEQLERRVAELEAQSHAPVPELVEKHVLVQQLLRRTELAEERVAELERKLAIVWRRVL